MAYIEEDKQVSKPLYVFPSDPSVALVNLRVMIEQRLKLLAHEMGLVASDSPYELVEQLRRENVFEREFAETLHSLLELGDQAAHGREITSDGYEPFRLIAGRFLEEIDRRVAEQANKSGKTLSPGTEVVVPWQLTDIRGEIVETMGVGPLAQAKVKLRVPGTGHDAEIFFPVGALRSVNEAEFSNRPLLG